VVEWLLIVAAVAGFAAVTGVAAQRVLEAASDGSADPAVRILEAEGRAAEIEAEARQPGSANLDAELRRRCREISQAFPDVVERARWDVSDPDAKKCQIEALSLP